VNHGPAYLSPRKAPIHVSHAILNRPGIPKGSSHCDATLGDVVIASDEAEFADHTLSVLGDAIFNDARTVREIIRQVESQRLGQARGSQTGVTEERATYLVGPARLPVDSASQEAWAGEIFRRFAPVAESRRCVSHWHRTRRFHEDRDPPLAACGAGSA
jgi:hypothetical protein